MMMMMMIVSNFEGDVQDKEIQKFVQSAIHDFPVLCHNSTFNVLSVIYHRLSR